MTRGPGPIVLRRHVRTPILSPWEARLVIPALKLWSPATILEISLGGARVELGLLPISDGDRVQLVLPWRSEAAHPLDVTWLRAHDNRVLAGLKRPLSLAPEDQRSWEDLVAMAMEHFRNRVREH